MQSTEPTGAVPNDVSYDAAPWAVQLDASVPAGLQRWLRNCWRARITQILDHEPLAHLSWTLQSPVAESAIERRRLQLPQGAVDLAASHPVYRLEGAQGGCRFDTTALGPTQIQCWGEQPELAVYIALTEIFRSQGWLSLHASAAILAGQQRVSVFIGRSGAGKTYRLLQSVRAGARPVAEDRLWIRAQDGLAVARDYALRVLPDTLVRFSDLLQAEHCVDADGKHNFGFAALGWQPAAPTLLGRIELLPSRRPEGASASPPSQLQFVQTLWEATGLPFTPRTRQLTSDFVQRHSREYT